MSSVFFEDRGQGSKATSLNVKCGYFLTVSACSHQVCAMTWPCAQQTGRVGVTTGSGQPAVVVECCLPHWGVNTTLSWPSPDHQAHKECDGPVLFMWDGVDMTNGGGGRDPRWHGHALHTPLSWSPCRRGGGVFEIPAEWLSRLLWKSIIPWHLLIYFYDLLAHMSRCMLN